MMIDYAPVVENSVAAGKLRSALGEFFAVPIFTCAWLMYMASAIDFIFIFVPLEPVTISCVASCVASISDAPLNAPITRSDRNPDLDLRKPGCAAAGQFETAARVFEHRARRLFADWRRVLGRPCGYLLSRCLFANDALELCRPRGRIAADWRSDFGLRWIREAVAISCLCH